MLSILDPLFRLTAEPCLFGKVRLFRVTAVLVRVPASSRMPEQSVVHPSASSGFPAYSAGNASSASVFPPSTTLGRHPFVTKALSPIR